MKSIYFFNGRRRSILKSNEKLSIVNTAKLENVECIHFCKNCG
jgi:hypothetical protein